ncbi:MAG: OsmC family peroxiredoxin, partial [Verrucomicrobiota bacterium]|nr:OsmC family peroxiredoxin [Verrucomicrobiota bacterium]
HEWDFGNGNVMEATAAPEFLGNPELVDPEQAFVASIASCHGLTFLQFVLFKKLRSIPIVIMQSAT